MPQEIIGQGDYYGLPEQSRGLTPSPEKIAEQLKPATPWQGPAKLAADEESEDDEQCYWPRLGPVGKSK